MKKKVILRSLIGAPIGLSISFIITLIISVIINKGEYYPVVPQDSNSLHCYLRINAADRLLYVLDAA